MVVCVCGSGLCTGCSATANATIDQTPSSCPSNYSPKLLGEKMNSNLTRTGLFTFNFQISGNGQALCPGRHRINFRLQTGAAKTHAFIDVVDLPEASDQVLGSSNQQLPAFLEPTGSTFVNATRNVVTTANGTHMTTTVTSLVTTSFIGAPPNSTNASTQGSIVGSI